MKLAHFGSEDIIVAERRDIKVTFTFRIYPSLISFHVPSSNLDLRIRLRRPLAKDGAPHSHFPTS